MTSLLKFITYTRGEDGKYSNIECKTCMKTFATISGAKSHEKSIKHKEFGMDTPEMKVSKLCKDCNETKLLREFYPSKGYIDGFTNTCISCRHMFKDICTATLKLQKEGKIGERSRDKLIVILKKKAADGIKAKNQSIALPNRQQNLEMLKSIN